MEVEVEVEVDDVPSVVDVLDVPEVVLEPELEFVVPDAE